MSDFDGLRASCPADPGTLARVRAIVEAIHDGRFRAAARHLRQVATMGGTPWHDSCQELAVRYEVKADAHEASE